MTKHNRLNTLPRLALILALLATLAPAATTQPAPAATTQPARAQGDPMAMFLPPGFVQERVVSGLDGPTSFDIAADGRIFVTQKAGTVRVVQDGVLLPENFIDLSYEVNQTADRGLMAVALHPNFPSTPWVYLGYAYEPLEAKGFPDEGARVARVLRLSASASNTSVHEPNSGVVILGQNSTFENIGDPSRPDRRPFSCETESGAYIDDCLPLEGTAHTLDFMQFGTDGALYVANGDGINYGPGSLRAQEVNSLAGKILRINPSTGAGYASNPFYNGDPHSNASKVWNLGMRNPFRFALHPTTGEVWVGDVGNNTWEEINRGGAGANYGWPCFEGPQPNAFDPICQPVLDGVVPTTQAVYSWPHERGYGAAIGGDFYTGSEYPAFYRNAYFFADFNAGTIQNITIGPDGTARVNDFASAVLGPVQIKSAPDGSLYVLSIITGSIYRIRYVSGGNTPPTAVAAADAISGREPLAVNFSAANSFDVDGDALDFLWDFGDDNVEDEENESGQSEATHVYEQPGTYQATLSVYDSRGAVQSTSLEILVGVDPPTAQITSPAPDARFQVGDTIEFSGTGVDPEAGELSGESLVWEAFLHHNQHVHYDFFDGTGSGGEFEYLDHGDDTYLELCLTATNSAGLSGQECVDIRPAEVDYTFDSEPSGLALLYNGTRYVTPFTVTTQVGSARQIAAPRAPATGVTFSGWSNEGPRSQAITIGDAPQTLTAVYTGTARALSALETSAGSGTITDAGEVEAVEGEVGASGADVPAAPSVSQANSSAVSTSTIEVAGSVPSTVTVSPVDEESAPSGQSAPESADGATPSTTVAAGGTGFLLREVYQPLGGSTLADLLDADVYPESPSESELLSSFDAPRPFADDYGQRLSGYLHPPTNGLYQFWIAADDVGVLKLSTDDNPANAVVIAEAGEWTGALQWDKYPSQASGTVQLEAGQRYYIEAISKEADGKDNLSVAWLIPGQERAVIDGQYLSPAR